MDKIPKDVIWLLMTEYFELNDALNCLSLSQLFWGRRSLEECRLELLRWNLCRAQRAHIRLQKCKFVGNQGVPHRCQYCGVRYRRSNTMHESQCKKLFIPKEEPNCKYCGCEYPTWTGSPHSRGHWRAHQSGDPKYQISNCPLQPAKCAYFGFYLPPFFPNNCNVEGCSQLVQHHQRKCKSRICAVCEEEVLKCEVEKHSGKGIKSGWCRVLKTILYG